MLLYLLQCCSTIKSYDANPPELFFLIRLTYMYLHFNTNYICMAMPGSLTWIIIQNICIGWGIPFIRVHKFLQRFPICEIRKVFSFFLFKNYFLPKSSETVLSLNKHLIMRVSKIHQSISFTCEYVQKAWETGHIHNITCKSCSFPEPRLSIT